MDKRVRKKKRFYDFVYSDGDDAHEEGDDDEEEEEEEEAQDDDDEDYDDAHEEGDEEEEEEEAQDDDDDEGFNLIAGLDAQLRSQAPTSNNFEEEEEEDDDDGSKKKAKKIRGRKIQSTRESGWKHVTWHKHRRKWHCQIQIAGNQSHFGYFGDPQKERTHAQTRLPQLGPYGVHAVQALRGI